MAELLSDLTLAGKVGGGIATALLIAVFAGWRMGFIRFGWPVPKLADAHLGSCPDPECGARLKTLVENRIERSQKTSGALHISEEALGKISLIEQNYLSRDKHEDLCRANLLQLKAEIKDHIDERLKQTEERLLKAINGGV